MVIAAVGMWGKARTGALKEVVEQIGAREREKNSCGVVALGG